MAPSMMTPGPHNKLSDTFNAKRGHTTQLSISDPSHHVTEAIGTLYGDEYDSSPESTRPLSYIDDGYQDELRHQTQTAHFQSQSDTGRQPLKRSVTDYPSASPNLYPDNTLRKSQTLHLPSELHRSSSLEHGQRAPPRTLSTQLSLRDVQADESGSQFPLTNIDNPTDIAQELSNLQALRRLSMDVGNRVDPDMPMTLSTIPAIAPSGNDDENDPSRLLWVPARVHPELAPSEFKSFLENRVNSIRRRSGESHLAADIDGENSDSSALRRRKSMLSHQIDNSSGLGAVGYMDGAERLEKQRERHSNHAPELSLEELVNDPAGAVQRLAQETQAQYADSQANPDDMPIIPMAPGMGLRRSTRTTYRKGGSLRGGDRGNLSRRTTNRHQGTETLVLDSPPLPDVPKGHALVRVQSEPIHIHENFSRPNRSVRRQNKFSQESPAALAALEGTVSSTSALNESQETYEETSTIRDPATTPIIALSDQPVSPTYETQDRDSFPQRSSSQRNTSDGDARPESTQAETISHDGNNTGQMHAANQQRQHHHHQQLQQQYQQHAQTQYTPKSAPPTPQSQTLSEGLASSPGLPGGGNTRTDALTFIPTLSPDERKSEKKSKKDRDDDTSSFSSKSSGAWKWLKGVTDDKKKEESKKSKAKAQAEKVQDSARLDVLQNSIDKSAPKARESLVLDRDSFDTKLQEERKKESSRRSDSKKDKDSSIFSSIFGGGKKREDKDKERSSKKYSLLQVPDEPVYKPLQPDVDYNWTRFPLLEERAIYRMAHIKLANPRRPLHSQVLLSNFMYSYLAIVQAMHPQMNIPVSPQQKRLEEEARRKQQEEQQYLAQQGLSEGDQQDMDQYNYDYHRSTIQYAESGGESSVDYVDEAQIYEDDHGDSQDHGYDYEGSKSSYAKGEKDYYEYREN